MEQFIQRYFPSFITIVERYAPMVIKELRQDLRMNLFLRSFLLAQILIVSALLLQLSHKLGIIMLPIEQISRMVIWCTMGMVLLIFIPRCGIDTMREEMQLNSLSLILLSRISAWHLLLGKWLGLCLQSLLFSCACLPYLLVGYFLGDRDLLHSVGILCFLILGCWLITAAGLACIAAGNREKNTVATIVALVFSSIPFCLLLWSESIEIKLSKQIGTIILAPCCIALLLDLGATGISLPWESYAYRKRAIGFITLFVGWSSWILGIPFQGLFVIAILALLVPLIFGSLCEELHPTMERDPAERTGSKVLWFYPGWPGGTVFAICLALGMLELFKRAGFLHPNLSALIYAELVPGLLLPWVLADRIPKIKSSLTRYIIAQILFTMIAASLISRHAFFYASFFPLPILVLEIAYGQSRLISYPPCLIFSILLSFLYAWLKFSRFSGRDPRPLALPAPRP